VLDNAAILRHRNRLVLAKNVGGDKPANGSQISLIGQNGPDGYNLATIKPLERAELSSSSPHEPSSGILRRRTTCRQRSGPTPTVGRISRHSTAATASRRSRRQATLPGGLGHEPKDPNDPQRPTLFMALPGDIAASYEVHEWRHGIALLEHVYTDEWNDIIEVLRGFRLCKSFIEVGGGNKSKVSGAIDGALYDRGWDEKDFATAIIVDDKRIDSPTHSVDCYRNGVALEIEWNNKDPFYDRDLNNFRLLFELRAVAVGVIVTRCDDLQELFNEVGRTRTSFGESTTHMRKLLPKIEGGGAGGCPVVVFGISRALYDPSC